MQAQGENTPPLQQPDRPVANPPFMVANTMFICGIDSPNFFKETHRPRRFMAEYLMINSYHAWIRKLNN